MTDTDTTDMLLADLKDKRIKRPIINKQYISEDLQLYSII